MPCILKSIYSPKHSFLILLGLLCHQTGSAQSIYDTLSVSEKVYGLSTIWKEASYNFVYFDKVPNLNWDSTYKATLPQAIAAKNVYEYHKVLGRFINLLKDGHTQVLGTQYFYKDIDSPPFAYALFEGRPCITRIDKQLITTVPVGSEILSIDSKSLNDFINTGGSLSGVKRTTLVLRAKTPDGKIIEQRFSRNINTDRVELYPPRALNPDVLFKQLPDDIAYVAINTFANDSVPIKFRQLLPLLHKARAVVIDIRRNGGGNSEYARQIAEYLVDKAYTVGPAWRTRIHNAANKAFGSAIMYNEKDSLALAMQEYYRGNVWEYHAPDTVRVKSGVVRLDKPLAVLIGKSTFSAAEDFLILIDGASRVSTIGQFTAGSSGQPIMFSLPAGMSGRVCAKRDTYPDGREFIGTGIKPDVLVKRGIDDYVKNKDAELEMAVEVLTKKLQIKQK